MVSLRETQDRFVADLLSNSASGDYLERANISANNLLNIYRNNLFSSHCTVIQETFPHIERLVGVDYVQHLVQGFIREVPYASGGMQDFGRDFAEFLRCGEVARRLPYLADIAELEWAMSESANAANLPSFNSAKLSRYTPGEYPDLKAVMHPSFRLVSSGFAIYDIWLLREDDSSPDLALSGQSVAVCRVDFEVYLRLLSVGQVILLQSLSEGENLAVALDAALAAEPELDFASFFDTCVRSGFFLDLKK